MAKRGPKTVAGRTAVRHNAVRHGILSPLPVVPGLEREEDWLTHRAGVLASIAPEGQLEQALAERVVLTLWRLRRVERYEYELIAVGQERSEEDLYRDPLELPKPFGEEKIEDRRAQWRNQLRIARQHLSLFSRFQHRSDAEPVSGEDAVAVLNLAADVHGIYFDDTPIHGLPPYDEWASFTGWSVMHLRNGVKAIRAYAQDEPDSDDALDAIAEIVEHFRAEVADLRRKLDRLDIVLDRQRRLRLLPSLHQLQAIARYEAHLNRQLYQALHELEALQARRQGEAAPLARLDVNAALPG